MQNGDRNEAAKAARARQDRLTKPRGSLGRLEDLVVQLAALQGEAVPRARPAAALVFAADHPVARHGVSAYPSAVTAAMLANFAAGGAAASVLARVHRVALEVIDVGVEAPPKATGCVRRHAVAARAEGDLRTEDAMDAATLDSALAAGREAVAELEPPPAVLLLGEIGIGNTSAAAAVAAAILGRPAAELVGRGTGLDDAGLARKAEVVSDAVARVGTGERPPLEALRRLGGRELAALVGAIELASARRVAILVDGFSVGVAALVAVRAWPSTRASLVFAHRSAEAGHTAVLDALDAEPLVDLGLRLGEASGALSAFPLLEAACRLHAEMATFEEAGVPDRPEAP